jgi:uncharacterized protein YbaA (DUF1428 family)
VSSPRANAVDERARIQATRIHWEKYGAIEYVECVADDVPPGKVTSFEASGETEEGWTAADQPPLTPA